MTRIIAGSAGGRRLATPRAQRTRPTSDRVREALFSAVESWCGSLDGLRFLDLYAGSGAVGLEAWSRGAGVVTLVEQDRAYRRPDRPQRDDLGFAARGVVPPSVTAALRKPPAAPYDVVFLDPPYPLDERRWPPTSPLLDGQDWLVAGRPGGRRAGSARPRAGVARRASWRSRSKKYGETDALVRSRAPRATGAEPDPRG